MPGQVIKFGGTSLGDAARIARAAKACIAAGESAPLAVVVSAMAGVTRRLRGITAQAISEPVTALAALRHLLAEHDAVAKALGISAELANHAFADDTAALIAAVGRGDAAASDRLLAAGESLSAALLHGSLAALGVQSTVIPAESVIATDDRHGHANVNVALTRQQIVACKSQLIRDRISIIAGFTGSTASGVTTTLGSNASDYSAALIAAALGWPLQIWTDVAGCYDADPRHVPCARLQPSLSLIDAHRYAQAGASVIHPRTLEPLLENPVAVQIVNSLAPGAAGTRIETSATAALRGIAVRELSSCDDISELLRIGLVIANPANSISADIVRDSLSIVSVFDDTDQASLLQRCRLALARTVGASSKLCWNPDMGSVCLAVDSNIAYGIARSLHATLFAPRKTVAVSVAVVGATGRVATRLIQLITSRRSALLETGIELKFVALSNSRRGCVDDHGFAADEVAQRLSDSPQTTLDDWSQRLLALPRRPMLLIDCSASIEVAALYPNWLAAGIDVITPNKHGPAAEPALWHAIQTAQRHSGARLACETTVGAQLPLLRTLRDLSAAGDVAEQLDAVLSGTLSYVLARVRAGVALSEAVRTAIDLGYAEPHPAADLSGADAARKLIILLRASGLDIHPADIEVIPLIAAEQLVEPNPARLLEQLTAVDAAWSTAAAAAAADGEAWVYRASYRDGRARVQPERVPIDSALARLQPCENALLLTTQFYQAAPLTISGPGAGIDLTAAGLYAELLDMVARYRPDPQRVRTREVATSLAA